MSRSLRYRAAGLLGVLLLAAAFRLIVLGQHELIEGDGVHYATLARSVLAGDWSGVSNPYWSNLWPGVIAATSVVTGLDVEGAGRLASLVSGLLVCLLSARLALRLFGPRTAVVAGLAAAIHPWLVQFSTLVFTESFFSCLLLSLLLLTWGLARAPGFIRAVVLGLVAAAALLTRPEALGTIAVAVAFVFAVVRRRAGTARASAIAGVVLLVVILPMGVRTLAVHHFYQEWDFGTGVKGTANLLIGLAPTDVDRERLIHGTDATDETNLHANLRHTTLAAFVWAHPWTVLAHVGQNLVLLARCVWRVFPPLPVAMGRPAFVGTPVWTGLDVANALCLVLGTLGLWCGLRGAPAGVRLLVTVVGVQFLGLAPFVVHDRMIVALAPLFLILFARGAVAVSRRRFGGIGLSAGLVLLTVLCAYGLLRTEFSDYASERPALKEAGLWLREHCPRDRRLMTVAPDIAFYFYDTAHQGNEVDLPYAEYPALMLRARGENVDLVAAPAWHLSAGRFPAAAQLLPGGDHPGLRHLVTVGPPEAPVHIFALDGRECGGAMPSNGGGLV